MTWPRVPLGTVAEVQLGKMLSPKARTGVSSFPYLRNVNVQWGRLELADLVEMDFDEDDRAKFALKKRDLLVCEGGEPGRCAVIDRDLPDVFFQKALMRVRSRDGRIETRFLQRFMEQAAARGTFAKDGNQATIAHFPAVKLNALEVPLPPLPEQRRIADILDKADAVRRKRKEAIALTEELLRSAFLEMFGDPVTNPKGWPVKPLTALGTVTTGNTPSRDVPEYFGEAIEWIKSDNINTPSHYLTPAVEGLSEKGRAVGRVAPAGSTLMTCIAGSPDCIGNVGLADREVAFDRQINAVTPNAGIDHRWLYVLLLLGKRFVQGASTNSMKGMVSKGKLEQVLWPAPPHEHQKEFGGFFDAVVMLNTRQDAAAGESDALFGSLAQRAFRGELGAA